MFILKVGNIARQILPVEEFEISSVDDYDATNIFLKDENVLLVKL